jgi:hypothetical protein
MKTAEMEFLRTTGIVSPENSVHLTAKSYRQANRRLNQLAAA